MEAQQENNGGFEGLVFLDPAELTIHESLRAGLDIRVGDKEFRGVNASLAMPITDQDGYVSLMRGESKDKEKSDSAEIGVIRDLKELAEDQAALVRRELSKRYFIHYISKIRSVKEKFGFIYIESETSKGRRDFAVRHEYNRVQEYGLHGRVILDTDDNRYVIPDMRDLSPSERKSFTRYFYW
jgi:hypothetical protein